MNKKAETAQILYLRPRWASAGRTRCFACGHEFQAYSELKHPIVQCPKCEGDCRVGQK